jgi:uncharacterized protein YjiS (DUF1127 family)
MENMRNHRSSDGKSAIMCSVRTLSDMKGTHMSTVNLQASHATFAGQRPGGRSAWQGRLIGTVDLLLTWYERRRQRRELQALSDHMLHDIGIGRGDVEAEVAKPFWRP